LIASGVAIRWNITESVREAKCEVKRASFRKTERPSKTYSVTVVTARQCQALHVSPCTGGCFLKEEMA